MSSLNAAPSANRIQIGFFGRRNAGKSSVVNAVTAQELAIVSPVPGTTTDPVVKAMELLPLGPVVIVDTPGIDDEGELGSKRIGRTRQVLNRIDIALLIVDATVGLNAVDQELLAEFARKNIPHLTVYNKTDLLSAIPEAEKGSLYVSATAKTGIQELKEAIGALGADDSGARLVGDLVAPGDFVVLVVPIDKAAPKGRLILPQQQAIRDLLDAGAVAVTNGVRELPGVLDSLDGKVKLVITDSQAFAEVAAMVPQEVLLTSFSILMARYKGVLAPAVEGAAVLDKIGTGDRILIVEGCTHHRQCDDIGTVKLPRWIRNHTGAEPVFEFVSGHDFPEDLKPYRLIVHCGGCMLNEREVRFRRRVADEQGVPMTNYGIAIAFMHGILSRSLAAFPEFSASSR